jgi:hypothetical protein
LHIILIYFNVFHLIILNIFLLFIATDLLLVIVNSCLERHLPHGLMFVIANSTSILQAWIEWFIFWMKQVPVGRIR